ncbi:Protein E6 [Melia azedarach]|uniref:Protein E6 n=1 Tax=Melia azedarach TaxID=155640 RepID=A0ACC1WWI7_MELAZ|nr:Protein E6 [Melia azedarach]
MAFSATNLICFLFLLTFFSAHIQARESQFFSKVPSSNGNNNVQVSATVPNKEEQSLTKQQQEPDFVPDTQKTTTTTTLNYQEQQQQSFGNKQQQEPAFVPETQNGYGLYGQENTVKYEPYTTPITSTASGSFEPYTTPSTSNDVKYEPYTTPSTSNDVKYESYTTPITSTPTGTFEPYNTPTTNTVNYEPYTTPTTSTVSTYAPYTTKAQTQESYNNNPNPYYYNNNYYNKNAFEAERESFGDSKFQHSGYTNLGNQNNFYTGYNNGEKLGMSDTRFLENGKYYYDIQNERSYHPSQYQQSSRGVVTGNPFNSRGYNANNENSYEYNSVEGYQNEENEFDELKD